MNKESLFVVLGGGGFPHKITAAGNKYFLIAKALSKVGFQAVLINKVDIKNNSNKKTGKIEKVEYVYLCSHNRSSTIGKIKNEIEAIALQFLYLQKYSVNVDPKYVLISYCNMFMIFYNWLIAKMLGYRLLVSVMEYHPALAKSLSDKIKSFLFWKIVFLMADGGLPISQFLYEKIKKRRKSLPLYKIPILSDFTIYEKITNYNKNKDFIYCGSLGYYSVVKLIIEAFLLLEDPTINLHLVVNGKEEIMGKFKIEIASYSNIFVYSQIPNRDLYILYASAIGLLIPMRPCIQDEARFPQKIAEYLASGTPIITNPVGEICFFFEHGKNAIFADNYSVEAYKNAMRWLLNNPNCAKQIGINGKNLGNKHFHYENIADQFSEFLKSL